MQATSSKTQTSTRSKWLVWTPVISDFGLFICLIAWCVIVVSQYRHWVDQCKVLYEPNSCIDPDGCDRDSHCRVHEEFTRSLISPSVDADESCYDCGECSCVIAGPWEALYISYVIFFTMAMLAELFKTLTVISAAVVEGCDPTIYGPIESSALLHCMDSWTLLLLRIIYPKRFEQLMKANEEGRAPVISSFKLSQWMTREFACGLIITLYPFKVRYFNGWLVPYVVFLIIYLIAIWQRSLWVDSKKPVMHVVNQPPVIAMMPVQQMPSQQQQQQTATGENTRF